MKSRIETINSRICGIIYTFPGLVEWTANIFNLRVPILTHSLGGSGCHSPFLHVTSVGPSTL